MDVVVVPRACTGAELTDVTGGAKLNGEEPLTSEVEDAPKKDDLRAANAPKPKAVPCVEPEACAGSELTGVTAGGDLEMVESSHCAGSGLTGVVTGGGASGVSVSELWSDVEPRACTGPELTGTGVTDETITLLGSVS